MVNKFTALFNCTPAGGASDLMKAPALSLVGPSGFHSCISVAPAFQCLSAHLFPSQCWIFIYMFTVLMHWWVGSHLRGLNNLYVYEPKQNLGRDLCIHKTGLTSPVIILTVPRRCVCCCWFYVSVFALFLFVFDFLFILFVIALWLSAGKELSSWISACADLLYAVFIVCVPFPFGVWGKMWNSIVSVLDHCLFVYSDNQTLEDHVSILRKET